jgi:hypothetical protein
MVKETMFAKGPLASHSFKKIAIQEIILKGFYIDLHHDPIKV